MSDIKWISIATSIFDDEKMCAIENLPDRTVVSIKAKKYYGKVARVVIRIREIEVDGGSSQIMRH